jgi:hypothetical protein
MLKRGRLFKKRLRAHRRKRGSFFKPIPLKRVKEIAFKACVFLFIAAVVLLVFRLFTPGLTIKASPETVAALRVPHRAIKMLYTYSAQYEIPFAELFVLFCAENDFFPEKNVTYDLRGIEQQYVADFAAIKRKYKTKNITPYVTMFGQIFDELISFPIPGGWEEDKEISYMYGDNWHVLHRGADIIDRENVRGRIPVVSMTEGIVQDAGYSEKWGYHIGIVTQNGNYYLYAHLDSLAAGASQGAAVMAGTPLGRMGNSGESGENRTVHLHIGISPKAGFSKNEFWINPYPLLRFID